MNICVSRSVISIMMMMMGTLNNAGMSWYVLKSTMTTSYIFLIGIRCYQCKIAMLHVSERTQCLEMVSVLLGKSDSASPTIHIVCHCGTRQACIETTHNYQCHSRHL